MNDSTVLLEEVKHPVLVLMAHPSLDRSEVNAPMASAAASLDGVTLVDLYAEYPDLHIDVTREQQRLLNHDVVVFQHPLYWYSTPAILKEWQDLVLEYGFAYGKGGDRLHGKIMLDALTAGGMEDAYRTGGYNHFSIGDLLQPLQQTANLCGLTWIPPFALFGSRAAVEDNRVQDHVTDWVNTLQALRDGRLDIQRAQDYEKLNDCLDLVITGGE